MREGEGLSEEMAKKFSFTKNVFFAKKLYILVKGNCLSKIWFFAKKVFFYQIMFFFK